MDIRGRPPPSMCSLQNSAIVPTLRIAHFNTFCVCPVNCVKSRDGPPWEDRSLRSVLPATSTVTMLLRLLQSLALTLMVCMIVTNWLGTIAVAGVALTAPQVYALLSDPPACPISLSPPEHVRHDYLNTKYYRPSSSRYCSQPLLDTLICNIGFTLFTTAFALILVLVDPVPRWLRVVFHVFGAASFIEGICSGLMTVLAADCAASTPTLYQTSVVLSVLNALSIGFFLVVGPFWLSNSIFPELVLNKQSRIGMCYEPVVCCPCFWHV